MGEKKRYQLEIAPLTIVAINRSPLFTYYSNENIPRGSLVKVPFGQRRLEGIVFRTAPLKSRVPSWMKPVEKVIAPSLLTREQCNLALFLSNTYLTPLGNCLKHFLPPRLKKPLPSDNQDNISPSPLPSLNKVEAKTLNALLKSSRVPKLYTAASTHEEETVLTHFLQSKIAYGKHVLFLVPELVLALWWQRQLRPYFGERLALVHSKLSSREMVRLWEGIRAGEKALIIGTRQALFAPFGQLDTIIITQEEDQTSYKQWEMSPRYTVRAVAAELAREYDAELLLVSTTPSLDALALVRDHQLKLIETPSQPRPDVELVNMRLEKGPQRKVLSDRLSSVLERELRTHRKVLLIGKQSGLTPLSVCANCKAVARCPQCENILVSERSGNFRCRHCGYKSDVFPKCRRCGHMTFRSYGAGTEKIEREVEKRFPHARILRLDRISLEKKSALNKCVDALRKGAYDILIGTYSSLKLPSLPGTGLIAMIEAESHLSFPDYQAEEKLLRDIERSRLILAQEKASLLLLQTFEPELPLFQKAAAFQFQEEAQALLAERAVLSYPPEWRFLKIECPAPTPEASEARALALAKDLSLLILKEKLTLSLIPPHLPLAFARQKQYQFYLRFPASTTLPELIVKWCRTKAANCHFDLDPMNLT